VHYLPGTIVSWAKNERAGIERIQRKLSELIMFVNMRQMIGKKHMGQLLEKVWIDRTEFNQDVSKMVQGYVLETAQNTGRDVMDVMMEMTKLFSAGN
jgi:hypothetical protein